MGYPGRMVAALFTAEVLDLGGFTVLPSLAGVELPAVHSGTGFGVHLAMPIGPDDWLQLALILALRLSLALAPVQAWAEGRQDWGDTEVRWEWVPNEAHADVCVGFTFGRPR